jgi:hypothetical protein
MAVMAGPGDLGHLAPDHLQARQRAAALVVQHQLRPRHHAASGIVFAGFRITQVDPAVVREMRMQDYVAEAALSAIGHFRDAADIADPVVGGCRTQRNQFQRASLLADQQTPIWQEGHCPWFLELAGFDDLEGKFRLLLCAAGGCGNGKQCNGAGGDQEIADHGRFLK